MVSALSVRLSTPSSFHSHQPNPFGNSPNLTLINPNPSFPIPKPLKTSAFRIINSSSSSAVPAAVAKNPSNPVIHNLKIAARAIVFAATAAAVISRFQQYPARAEPATQNVVTTEPEAQEETVSPGVLESNSEDIDAMKTVLLEKLDAGEGEESLRILKKLISVQPDNTEWKLLMARLLSEMGDTQSARDAFEGILAQNPLSFEALFENALLMDKCGEGKEVIKRLEQALEIAEEERKVKEARDVRLIMAQIQFLQKNVEEALRSYDELSKEDPNDFRPYFCRGMIFSLMDKDSEAKEQFAKYRELSPKKFEVEGYLRTPLSRMKFFGPVEQN